MFGEESCPDEGKEIKYSANKVCFTKHRYIDVVMLMNNIIK